MVIVQAEPFDPAALLAAFTQRMPDAGGIVSFTGLVESGTSLRAIQVKGVDPVQETQLSALPHFVLDNAWSRFHAGEQQIILGKGVADAFGVAYTPIDSLL